ncbi:class I SAM-dependent methyltransferase [Nisaea nitritireducens]|uniref:class I SAM-dependent methyltransferase n=1 Tax=Nisaea nitritireducens TaxID=568392 RepID=UPI001865F810|nr:class I SAM-dependent methyltransferase [Nisaea nitritireducens]
MTADIPQWNELDTAAFLAEGDVFVPRREEQIRIVTDRLFEGKTRPACVFDLCSGEGLMTKAILDRDPDVKVTAYDASPGMLKATAKTAGDAATRLTARPFRLEELDWRFHAEPADAVVSSLAVHHLDGPGKARLFRDLFRILTPGGVFVLADLVEPASDAARRSFARQWEHEVEQRSLALRGDSSGLERFRALDWNHYDPRVPDPLDKPSTLVEQTDWLRDAGFEQVDLLWCVAGHVILSAVKPAA